MPDSRVNWRDFQDILVCPYSHETLAFEGRAAISPADGTVFRETRSGALDFRLKRPKAVTTTLHVGTPASDSEAGHFCLLTHNPAPEVALSDPATRNTLSRREASHLPKASGPGAIALDLGCDAMAFRPLIEAAGFRYVGIDIANDEAMLLGDAHALPFADGSVEFVFANAMLQYTQNPFVVMDEIRRVLKDDGVFMGTAAFLEGFDGNSFFFMTRNAVMSLLAHGRFEIEFVSPDPGWMGFSAINNTSFFPGLPTRLHNLIWRPYEMLSLLWWQLVRLKGKPFSRADWLAHTTAAFIFRVRKAPEGATPAE